MADKLDHDKIIDYLAERYANPLDNRSLLKISEDLGISNTSIYKINSENSEEIYALAAKKRKKYHDLMRSLAYNALISRLPKSDKAIELLFKVMGDLVERSEVTNLMTPEQKKEKITELMTKLSSQLKLKDQKAEEKK